MAKKKWLLIILKKLFLCEHEHQPDNETKEEHRKHLPEFSAIQSTLQEAKEEHMKHAITSARVTAAAAEASVLAAQAAAAVVRLTGIPQIPHHSKLREKDMQNWAATRIQTPFRSYLAIVRGRAARRRVRRKLERYRSPLLTMSRRKVRMQTWDLDAGTENGNKCPPVIRTKMELGEPISSERRWNDSMYSKEEAKLPSLRLRRPEAISRKDRMRQYIVYSNLTLEEPLSSRPMCSDQQRYWLRHWTREKLERSEQSYSPFSNPRRSLCQMREGSSVSTCSPILPTYMATTESAKARVRSMSTPRQRIKYLDHYYNNLNGGDSYKNMGEAVNSVSRVQNGSDELRSLSMRSLKQA